MSFNNFFNNKDLRLEGSKTYNPNFWKNILLSILGGGLLALSFPPLPCFILAFFAFIPIFKVLEYDKIKHLYLYVYIMFFIYHAGTNWWISSWQENTDIYLFIAGIVTAFFHPLFFLFPFFIYSQFTKLVNRNIAVWFFPFIWIGFEWLHSLGDLAYSWLTVGYTQYYNSTWYQIVDIAGIWGPSFLVVLVNVILYKLLFGNKNYFFFNRRNIALIFVLLIIFIVPYMYGVNITKYYNQLEDKNKTDHNKSLIVGVIQPNINPWDKWEKNPFEQITLHLKLQDSLYNNFGKVDLFVWNETAIPTISLEINEEMQLDFIKNNLYYLGNASLMTGFSQYKTFKSCDENLPITARYLGDDTTVLFASYNSAILLSNDRKNIQIYHKQRLTPFSENIPYVKYLPFMKDLFVWGVGISSWEKGTEFRNFAVPVNNKDNSNDSVLIAPIICIESIYPGFVREFVDRGAEVMTVISNDAWYDYTFGPYQHYMIAATRAMENRRYLARCANSGISGIISPLGKNIIQAQQYKTTAVAAKVYSNKDKTIYTKLGDFLPEYSSALICFIFIIALINKLSRRNNKLK